MSAAAPRPAAAAEAAPAAGMRAYVDPQTGEFTAPPAGAAPEADGSALSRSSERLVEVPGTTPAGGVMVNVRGRLLSTFAATVDAAGKPAIGCHATGATTDQE